MVEEKNVDHGKNLTTEAIPNTHEGVNTNDDEKLFTQSEVNEIIRKRLERGKKSAEQEKQGSLLAEREQQLNELQSQLAEREALLSCKTYLQECGYPSDLADVLDTSDPDKFKQKADAVMKMNLTKNIAPLGSNEPVILKSPADNGFSIDYKHKPKSYEFMDE